MPAYDTRVLPGDAAGVAEAARLLAQGDIVGLPTETVYGLAADAASPQAVAAVFAAKGRPADNPLIVHIADMAQLADVARQVPAAAQRLAQAFWPGPLTMVLPRAQAIPPCVSAGLDTVAVRMPAHPVAQAVLRACKLPLAAPSGNLSGRPSPTTAAHMLQDMAGRIPLILDGGACGVGVESTVVSLCGEAPTLLRPGAVTVQMLSEVLGVPVQVAAAVTQPLQPGQKALSPGMKYRHYAPRAALTLLHGSTGAYTGYVNAHAAPGLMALCFAQDVPALQVPCVTYGDRDDPTQQAQQLFGALRRLDDEGAKTVLAHAPQQQGAALAVYNRLLRAAAFCEVRL